MLVSAVPNAVPGPIGMKSQNPASILVNLRLHKSRLLRLTESPSI